MSQRQWLLAGSVVSYELQRARRRSIGFIVGANGLTREYRVNSGVNQYRYNTLNEALLNVSRVSQWRVLWPNQYSAGEPLEGSVRINLNTSRLPRTYQLNSLTNQGWGLNSGWYTFNFTPR